MNSLNWFVKIWKVHGKINKYTLWWRIYPPIICTIDKKTMNCSIKNIKQSELHKFIVLPKPWSVERTFAWLYKSSL